MYKLTDFKALYNLKSEKQILSDSKASKNSKRYHLNHLQSLEFKIYVHHLNFNDEFSPLNDDYLAQIKRINNETVKRINGKDVKHA